MEEPTVLDYVKSKLLFWRGERLTLPEEGEEMPAAAPEPAAPAAPLAWGALPWASLLALGLALLAQLAFEPPDRSWKGGLAFYAAALSLLALARRRGEWQLPFRTPPQAAESHPASVRSRPLFAALFLLLLAFLAFGGNQFTLLNLYLWLLGLAALVTAFWEGGSSHPAWYLRLWRWLRRPYWEFRLQRSHLVWLALFALALWFRFYRLGSVPPEMVSDHAEKLWDVWDVLHGQRRIFFPRNTGREFFQMYLTAAVILLFHTGYSFLSLKIGTAFMGLFTLPWVYLLGKELGNRRVGLLAMAFAGLAYWPNVIARAALRFTLYPAFTAPVLYYLLRGLRQRRRNDFILAGLWLGLGLHGYSPMRIVPFVVAAAVGLYLLHRAGRGGAAWGFVLTGVFSFAVFLPLLRYMLEYPEMVSYRAMTRLTGMEHPLPGSPLAIFFSNLGRALAMFAWDNGNIWVHSLPGRPALGLVAAALFHLGAAMLLARYLRKRRWEDLFVLLSIPLLMLPSILSLAFPAENPSLNRTGGALIPVFVVLGFALEGLLHTLETRLPPKTGRRAALGLAALLLGISALQNYAILFVEYNNLYRQSSWNTSEMGRVVRGFIESGGKPENAWTVAYPYWVDTRLVGINAGLPFRDTQIWPDQIAGTRPLEGNKLFLVKPDDLDGQQTLEQVYPEGVWQMHLSAVEGKDFLLYWVPARTAGTPPPPPPAEEEDFPPYPTPTAPPEP